MTDGLAERMAGRAGRSVIVMTKRAEPSEVASPPTSASPTSYRMSAEDAEEYTVALGQVMSGGWRQIALAQKLGVPAALGMTTREWVQERIGGYVRRGLEERREAVKELTDPDGDFQMSQRQAAEVLGVGVGTVNRDLGDVPDGTPEGAALGADDDGDVPDGTPDEDDDEDNDDEDEEVAEDDAPSGSGPSGALDAIGEDGDADDAEMLEDAVADDPSILRARLAVQFSTAMSAARELVLLRPDAVAGVVTLTQRPSVESFVIDVRAWLLAFENELKRPLHVVGGNDGSR